MGSIPGRNCNNGEEAGGVGTLPILNVYWPHFAQRAALLQLELMCPNLNQEKHMRTRGIYGSTGKETNMYLTADGRN